MGAPRKPYDCKKKCMSSICFSLSVFASCHFLFHILRRAIRNFGCVLAFSFVEPVRPLVRPSGGPYLRRPVPDAPPQDENYELNYVDSRRKKKIHTRTHHCTLGLVI